VLEGWGLTEATAAATLAVPEEPGSEPDPDPGTKDPDRTGTPAGP
jgi:hypothetical protein